MHPPGTWNDECARCRPGTYAAAYSWSPMSNVDKCTDCPLGTCMDQLGATECTQCDVGKYASMTGLRSCTDCPPGTYSDGKGASECTPCAAGTYADGYGTVNCTLCSAGTYQNSTGATDCKNCTIGTHMADEGAEECLSCGEGLVRCLRHPLRDSLCSCVDEVCFVAHRSLWRMARSTAMSVVRVFTPSTLTMRAPGAPPGRLEKAGHTIA